MPIFSSWYDYECYQTLFHKGLPIVIGKTPVSEVRHQHQTSLPLIWFTFDFFLFTLSGIIKKNAGWQKVSYNKNFQL